MKKKTEVNSSNSRRLWPHSDAAVRALIMHSLIMHTHEIASYYKQASDIHMFRSKSFYNIRSLLQFCCFVKKRNR